MSQRIFHLHFRHILTSCIFFLLLYISSFRTGTPSLRCLMKSTEGMTKLITMYCNNVFWAYGARAEAETSHKIYEQNNRGWHFNHLNFLSIPSRGWHFFHFSDTVPTARGRAQAATSVTLNRLCSRTQKDVCASHGKRHKKAWGVFSKKVSTGNKF